MIRKIEYTDNDNLRRAFSFSIPSGELTPTQDPDIALHYLEDGDYLEDIDNGYIDENGDPSNKLVSTIKNIERINENTWEFVVTNISRFDNRSIREGKITGIKTYHDKWAEKSDLITGIGDHKDCIIDRIDQETEPDIMSKDLFIGSMSGFTTGFSSGLSNDVQYAQILNPVNFNNVNNYYPVLNHGYFYDGEFEYYTYGNKQTEVLNPDFIETDDAGNKYFTVSGTPNILSPIMLNMIDDTYPNVVGNVNISDFQVYSNNSYRERFDSLPISPGKQIEHGLASDQPFVYLTADAGDIRLPDISILSKNEIIVDAPVNEFHGYVNIIRPNSNVRSFNIDVKNNDATIAHGLNSTNLFIFFAENDELTLIESAVLDENNIYIPQLGVAGKLIIFNVQEYSSQFYYPSFSSGTINHDLNLTASGQSYFIDPWVYGSIPDGPTKDEIVIADATIIDPDNIYVDFGETVSDVTITIIDFWKLNDLGALFNSSFSLNTDMFSFQENLFYGNEGVATPFHRIYPTQDGNVENTYCKEYKLRCQTDKYKPRPLDFITGYYEEELITSDEPVYMTVDNKLYVPDTISGIPVIVYEKEREFAHEFRFRGTDVSPVSWYNTDRIIAIQPEDQDLANIELYPDVKSINLRDASTRSLIGSTTELDLTYFPFDIVEDEPTTSSKVTLVASDDAGVVLKDQLIEVTTKRRLYKKVDSSLTRLHDYSISVIDNTKELFSLPSGTITSILSGVTVYSPSLFDEITFLEGQGDIEIYDDDGYLFTSLSGYKTFRVPFVGSLYDENQDILTHELYKETNVFGSSVAQIGFHNNRRSKRVKTLRVTAYPSGQTQVNTDIIDTTTIIVKPFASDDTVGSIDINENPNPVTEFHQVEDDNIVTIIQSTTTPSTIRAYDQLRFNEVSGIVSRSDAGGIIDVYDTGEDYIVELDYDYVPQMPSGAASGYIHYTSGMTLRYDTIDAEPSIFERGEYYD